VNGPFWQASVYADGQMTGDEHWSNSSEGQFLMRLLKRENERLKRIIQREP